MAGAREIHLTIIGDDRSGSSALKTLGSTADTTEIKIGGLGKSLGVLGTAGAVALGTFAVQGVQALGTALVGMIGDAQESAAVAAQLAAVLKSTGGAAGLSADDVTTLADSLSALTGIDDEAIVSAQSVLLTFTNIGKEVFPDATQAVLDLSTAMGGDMQGAAVQVGKALNDPIAGITALTRVGVTFTDQQKDQIAAMVEVGNVAGAQQIILAELSKEFGGSAEAQATNVKKMTVAWGNFREAIGGALLPIIEKFAGALNTMLRSEAFQTALGNITSGLQRLIGVLDDPTVQAQFREWKDAAEEFGTSFNAAFNNVQTVALPALQDLATGLGVVKTALAEPIVSVLWAGAIDQLADLNQLLEYYILLTGGTLPNALTTSQNASDGLGNSVGQAATEVDRATFAVRGLVGGATDLANRLSGVGSGLSGAATAIGTAMPSVTDMGHGLQQLALSADNAASATERATQAYNAHVQAIQGLNSEQSALQALLTPLQAEWDALNVATENGAHVTAAQQAAYARLAPSIEYLNGQIGVNKSNTVDATLAAIAQKQALDNTTTAATLEGIAQTGAGVAATLAAAVKAGASATTKKAVDDETGAVGLLRGAIEKVPPSLSTTFTAPGLDQGITDIGGNLVNAIHNVPSSFTVTAHVDISGALASIQTLSDNLPHSPAKEGPFRTLPNWRAIFDMAPALTEAATMFNSVFGAMGAVLSGGFSAGGFLGGLPPLAGGNLSPGGGGHVGAPIPGINPVTGQPNAPFSATGFLGGLPPLTSGGFSATGAATTIATAITDAIGKGLGPVTRTAEQIERAYTERAAAIAAVERAAAEHAAGRGAGTPGPAPATPAAPVNANAGVESRLDTIITLIRAATAGGGDMTAIAEGIAGIILGAAGTGSNATVAQPAGGGWR